MRENENIKLLMVDVWVGGSIRVWEHIAGDGKKLISNKLENM